MKTVSRYVFFGASSIKGSGDPEGGFVQRFSLEKPEAEVINAGIGGQTTREMIQRLDVWKPQPGTVGLIMLGSNDIPRDPDDSPARRTTRPEYRANLEKIFRAASAVPVVVATSFPICPNRGRVSSEVFNSYMDIFREVAQEFELPLVDWHQEIQKEDLESLWAPDGIHLNALGHQWLLKKTHEAFQRLVSLNRL